MSMNAPIATGVSTAKGATRHLSPTTTRTAIAALVAAPPISASGSAGRVSPDQHGSSQTWKHRDPQERQGAFCLYEPSASVALALVGGRLGRTVFSVHVGHDGGDELTDFLLLVLASGRDQVASDGLRSKQKCSRNLDLSFGAELCHRLSAAIASSITSWFAVRRLPSAAFSSRSHWSGRTRICFSWVSFREALPSCFSVPLSPVLSRIRQDSF